MSLTYNGTRERRLPGESEFSAMHRLDLPRRLYFTDFDSMLFSVDHKIYQAVEETNTFLEYTRPLQFRAIFDLKGPKELNDALLLAPYGSVWGQYQAAKRLNCRFFIISSDKKKPPFTFYEVMSDVVRKVGILDYTTENRRENATAFWLTLGLINEDEAKEHLRPVTGNFEVETIHLENGHYKKREWLTFTDIKSADHHFNTMVSSDANALIAMRVFKNSVWHMVKSEYANGLPNLHSQPKI
jgi:hypothetical protein